MIYSFTEESIGDKMNDMILNADENEKKEILDHWNDYIGIQKWEKNEIIFKDEESLETFKEMGFYS